LTRGKIPLSLKERKTGKGEKWPWERENGFPPKDKAEKMFRKIGEKRRKKLDKILSIC